MGWLDIYKRCHPLSLKNGQSPGDGILVSSLGMSDEKSHDVHEQRTAARGSSVSSEDDPNTKDAHCRHVTVKIPNNYDHDCDAVVSNVMFNYDILT